jgi:hypothetical protein
MRRRMVFSTLLVTVIAVMLLGLPLGALTYKLVHDESSRALLGEAELIGAESDTMLEIHDEVNLAEFERDHPERFIRITTANGSSTATAGVAFRMPRSIAPM